MKRKIEDLVSIRGNLYFSNNERSFIIDNVEYQLTGFEHGMSILTTTIVDTSDLSTSGDVEIQDASCVGDDVCCLIQNDEIILYFGTVKIGEKHQKFEFDWVQPKKEVVKREPIDYTSISPEVMKLIMFHCL